MNQPIRKVVIVGGGTAGWITAGAIAAESHGRDDQAVQVVLVESPDIPIIGVGEGTWPSMRITLQRMGLSEDALIGQC
ncbi:MAG: tryptophan 7-halogenase, partial [Rhodospirillaceae bacterium]|nr:tryptophan 7-halogenase [Rhodospirillaceae bacterium]